MHVAGHDYLRQVGLPRHADDVGSKICLLSVVDRVTKPGSRVRSLAYHPVAAPRPSYEAAGRPLSDELTTITLLYLS